jgi:autophagy-related protein 2
LPPPGASSHTLGSKAKEHENEEEGDGDTLDSDEFCILDAPGLGIAVCVLGWGLLGRRSSLGS